MDTFSNFSTTMIYIGVVAIVLYVLFFSFALASVIRIRKEARQMLEKGFSFEEEVNTEKIKLFYCYKEKYVTTDCAGDKVYAPYFTDENGTEVNIFSDIKHEVFIGGLTPGSMIPSKGYRVAVTMTCLKHNDDDSTYKPNTLQIFLRPAKNDISKWVIIQIDRNDLILEHPLMGELCIPKHFKEDAELGQEITLISKVTEFAKSYRLEYETV